MVKSGRSTSVDMAAIGTSLVPVRKAFADRPGGLDASTAPDKARQGRQTLAAATQGKNELGMGG